MRRNLSVGSWGDDTTVEGVVTGAGALAHPLVAIAAIVTARLNLFRII
jgi:hypothetical protein